MLEKLRIFYKRHKGILLFLLLGIVTTVVNYAVYLPLYNYIGMTATVSNCIAWVAAVTVSFLTNKPFVFESYDWSAKTVVPELVKYVGCRIGTGVAETAAIFIAVDLLGMDGNIIKLITSIMVIVLNYMGTKLFVFRRS